MRIENYTDRIPCAKDEEEKHMKWYQLWERKKTEPGFEMPYSQNVLKSGNYQIDENSVVSISDKKLEPDSEQELNNWEDEVNQILDKFDLQEEIEKTINEQKEQEIKNKEIAEKIMTQNMSNQANIDEVLAKKELAENILKKNHPQSNVNKIIDRDDGR